MSEALAELRQRLDSIDDRILDLLRQRNDVVAEVSQAKLAAELPVFVPSRESEKAVSFRRQAASHGLDPDWAEDFLRMIMGASRAQQSTARFPRATAAAKRVLFVGGEGGMAQLFGHFFRASGHRVRSLDRDDWGRVETLTTGVDAVIVAVPIRRTAAVIDRLAPYLGADTVLADFTSQKADVLGRMLAAHPGPVLGLHPMHGPDVENLSKQLLLACPGRAPEESAWLLQQAALWGMRIKTVDPKAHDRAMHLVQGLRHYLALLHGSFLRACGLRPSQILDYSSPIYRAELMMTGRIFAQDAELYADIVLAEPQRRHLLEQFRDHHERLATLVREDDKEGFAQEFNAIRDFFGDFAEQALEESGYLIHRLADRFA